MAFRIKEMNDITDFLHSLWKLAAAIGVTPYLVAAVATIAGILWAYVALVPLPLLIMVGFTFFVACAALVVLVSNYFKTKPRFQKVRPNYAAWQHVESFTLADAAKLWTDHEPRAGVGMGPDAGAWLTALKDAVRTGRIEIEPTNNDDEQTFPMADTTVSRDELKKFAGPHAPKFLR
jgi:hypothetical protein